jgi:hypothetical protein
MLAASCRRLRYFFLGAAVAALLGDCARQATVYALLATCCTIIRLLAKDDGPKWHQDEDELP